MGLFSKIFGKKEKVSECKEYSSVLEFNKEFDLLLSKEQYIARSDYVFLIEKYKECFELFKNIDKANMLKYYCRKNKFSFNIVTIFLNNYINICDIKTASTIIEKHNEDFLNNKLKEEKDYLDNILKDIDSQIVLDDEQRKVILSDEDYTLVIAGAGAGKTTTVAAKVKYLVEKCNIDPKQILVISFTNKSVNELKERINDGLSIDCPITTFHKAGYAILRKQEEEKKEIVRENFMFFTIRDYLKNSVLKQNELVNKIIMFFGSYFDSPYEGEDINLFFDYIAHADFSSLKSNINEYNTQIINKRTGKKVSILNEVMRSAQEVQIANFLYMHKIDYEYEPIYPYHILKACKPYTPDFCIKQGDNVAYIEHFGITESGQHSFYSKKELTRYKNEINDKIKLHKQHGTDLIYTFSSYNDGHNLLTHLEELLKNNGFVLEKRDSKEVFEKIVSLEENKYINRFVNLISIFIKNFKTNDYNIDDFERFERSGTNVRTKLFLDICKACYYEYQSKLKQHNAIDFEDMINESARILHEKQILKEKIDFKYIIVDEYQDISRQRFDFTKALSEICDGKIIAVGDDWQSIYAYAGSDITLFSNFCKIMGYGKELKITKTYRNSQEVIDVAGNFIQKNKTQIRKKLESNKHITKPIIIQTYSEDVDKNQIGIKGGKYYNLGKTVDLVIEKILLANEKEGKGKNASILLVGRYGFDVRNICFSDDFIYDEIHNRITSKKYKHVKLEFLTAHKSKGLGYDNVIIINARNELYGFPSKIQMDPIMKYVTKDDNSIEYAEERRLFYVAMTRTKNRVFIVTPENHPSEFVTEIINDYPNVIVRGNLIDEKKTNISKIKKCPICGYPLQLRWKKNYGLKLWICTNEPEVCNYITNEINKEGLGIKKCDCCKDGYLIVKKNQDGTSILGCTNYKKDKTGCNRVVNKEEYDTWLSNGFEKDHSISKPSFEKIIEEDRNIPIPTIKEIKPRKKQPLNRTRRSEIFVEKEKVVVITDNTGNVMTDIELLKYLREFRKELAKEKDIPAYQVMNNKALASIATYTPENKEEFISLYGLGEIKYKTYGKQFIEKIKEYYENK